MDVSTSSYVDSSMGPGEEMELFPESAIDETSINGTKFDEIIKDIKTILTDEFPHLGYLALALLVSIAWIVYIILFNTRIQGTILTAILGRFFIKKGNITIGSFSLSVLSGRIMFRNLVYVTEDYSLRIVDGILKFRYWLPYVKRQLSEDMSHCDHRVWLELNGPELHIYDRTEMYSRLERIFGLDPHLKSNFTKVNKGGGGVNDKSGGGDKNGGGGVEAEVKVEDESLSWWEDWRDLLPVIKVDLHMARFVFGNRLVASTLLLTMDKAECYYTTKPAACSLDHFMHVFNSKAENFRVIMAPSPKYTGVLDEPPRYMGEGFVVMSSSLVHLYYYMDEPGLVPQHPQTMCLPNGDEVSAPAPVWGIDIKCEKGTNLSYGPWADRQREHLFKFFFPQDYQKMQVTKPQTVGERRQVQQFDIHFNILTEATIDILFSKEKETSAVHMNVQRASYFEMTLPWVVGPNGYTTKIKGQLFHVDASTSLQYRNLLEAETLDYEVNVQYPRHWNHHQTWDLNFNGSKVTYHFVYVHKFFFQDLMEDWSSTSLPDLLHFVPYTWNFVLNLNQFELVTLANGYNWVDCTSQHQANAHVAFCGNAFTLKFSLPFIDLLPETIKLDFDLKGSCVDLSLYLPPSNTSKNIIAALDRNAKLVETNVQKNNTVEKWRKFCKFSAGWIDVWHVTALGLSIGYKFHPVPPLGPSPHANVSTPEKEELLLSPIRAPMRKKSPKDIIKTITPEQFDPMTLTPDYFSVEVKVVEPSEIKLYGSVLRQFIHLKENIFGEDQKLTDMEQSSLDDSHNRDTNHVDESKTNSLVDDNKKPEFDPRKFRPFEVVVNVDIRNVTGHLMKDCTESDPACPTISLDCLVFEMKKKYQETLLQVIVSPLILTCQDNHIRLPHHHHLKKGFALLSGLQMRGHAMFSDLERDLGEETLEYGWLVELTVGTLSGKLTTPQLQHILTALKTFIFTLEDDENNVRPPVVHSTCYHGSPQPECIHTTPDHFCPTNEAIKYKMVRVSIDGLDMHLVEQGADLGIQIYPIRLATCNLHGQHTRSGITAYIQNIKLRNYICGQTGMKEGGLGTSGRCEAASVCGMSASGMCSSTGGGMSVSTVLESDTWLEAAAVTLGPISIDAAISSDLLHHDLQIIQHKFLKLHDNKTKRCWFLWSAEVTSVPPKVFGRCGCVGGCAFFGNNQNGPSFFKPSKQDFTDGKNIAQLRVNDCNSDPGYGQSILKESALVFDTVATYNHLSRHPHHNSHPDMDHRNFILSSGYNKNASPATPADIHASRGSSIHNTGHHHNCAATDNHLYPRHTYQKEALNTSQDSSDHQGNLSTATESSTLGRISKDQSSVDGLGTPGSLSDLRRSADNVNSSRQSKMPSSLSLQTEIPLAASAPLGGHRLSGAGMKESNSKQSLTSQQSFLQSVQRTLSISSETQSEAFFSADEDQMTMVGCTGGSLSRMSSQHSLAPVIEDILHDDVQDITVQPSSPEISKLSKSPLHSSDESLSSHTCSVNSSNSSSTSSRSSIHQQFAHSQTSLLGVHHHSKERVKIRKRRGIAETLAGDGSSSSDAMSVSSTSFISAVSSQEDIALVDLHMQLNKPIMESPLLMSSYINHMTQLRCVNWESAGPSFSSCSCACDHYTPAYEKISEGFTAIKMVEGNSRVGQLPRSPAATSSRTPSHPYTWDSPIFTWGTDKEEETKPDEQQELLGGICEANTTRTTVVMKFKKDVDITLSPMGLESAQLLLEALTPVLEGLHPMSIVNQAQMEALDSVAQQNTLKKDRYMYWWRLRDKKVAGTPEQSAVLSTTYLESCFKQMHGNVTIPRVNITLLQASVVEEVISFSALDNIRDLTCVSLFSVCIDNVGLQFYSGHQSNKSVQMYMRNPHDPIVQKKGKSKTRSTVDLLAEPVYIETSEKQQEENMASVNVSRMHVQLRRLKNESALLKDASITAIPNHRSKVLFTFKRCGRGSMDEDRESDSSTNASEMLEDERMGFIMCEAGLENIALKAVKRKGFGGQATGPDLNSSSKSEGSACGGGSTATAAAGGSASVGTGNTAGTASANGHDHSGLGPPVINSQKSGPEHKVSGGPGTTAEAPSAVTNANIFVDKGADAAVRSASISIVSNASTHSGAAHSQHSGPTASLHSGAQASMRSGAPPGSAHSHAAQSNSTANESSKDVPLAQAKEDKKDITSFMVELRTVWFNFAAPPHSPITKKIDYTRLDWNLLSTASPSINAWMNPSDRLTVAVIQYLHASESRRLGVMASLMAEALDVQSIHVPVKTKYVKLTPLSTTLQEDPSCQLCTVLRRYLLQSSLRTIEANLSSQHLPKLATLRQGVVVLSRQWKNALYMPLLTEQNFRNKHSRPAFNYRQTSALESRLSNKLDLTADFGITDEKTTLLEAECGVSGDPKKDGDSSSSSSSNSVEEITEGVVSSGSTQLPPRRVLPCFPPRSSHASVTGILPTDKTLFNSPHRFKLPKLGGFGFLHSGSGGKATVVTNGHVATGAEERSATSRSSASDRLSSDSHEGGGTPHRKASLGPRKDQDDLYNWMVKQQEYNQTRPEATKHTVTFPQGEGGLAGPVTELGSEHHEEPQLREDPGGLLPEPQGAHFLEAHIIFEPLLSAIGVMAQQVSGGALEQLGSNVTITGSVCTFRVDIIESEASKLNRKRKKTGLNPGKFYLDIGSEVPAFLCEHVGLEIDVSKVADDSREWVSQQPTLYVSRSTLKQHTSTILHFSLNVNYIAQQVNMPLLRLLHQISSMYQNARETQIGLKEQRPRHNKESILPDHHKNGSYSELHESSYKGAGEYSLSISEEQATVSSMGGLKGHRGSMVSSLSARMSPPPPSTVKVNPRPQSFAQRLRSSTKMNKGNKGYLNLGSDRPSGSPLFSISVSGSGLEGATICSSDKSPLLGGPPDPPSPEPLPPTATPKCWRNIYYLLDLYTTTPETKTVQQRPLVAVDVSESYKGSRKYDILKEPKQVDIESATAETPSSIKPPVIAHKSSKEVALFTGERTPLVVFGLAKIQRIKLLATLSGLKLEAEMNAVHSSLTFREKVRGFRSIATPRSTQRTSSELSHTGHIGSTMIVLLEGIAPNQQTVVRVTIGKSQGLYSSLSRKTKDKNSALITIGDVTVDIPQHPVILHDMMTRGTKQLSTTLQELRVARPSARLSRGATVDETETGTTSPRPPQEPAEPQEPQGQDSLLHPLVIQFSILLQSLSIQAALLPSLQAQYRMEQVSSLGITGAKAKFNMHLPTHHLSFSTRLQGGLPSETHLPSSASIELPQVHVEAEFIQDDATQMEQHAAAGMVLREGSYLSAVAEIGALERSLTTDLLNHLVFVQKVFMKEVNEVVQKMAGGDKPVPLWTEEEGEQVNHHHRQLLFTLQLRLKGIIITATTPTQSAVRLETGMVELQLSNRVENVSQPTYSERQQLPLKIFGKAQVDINVALGQLIKNDMFEEAEPEFQQLAFFRTRICLRNALYNEMLSVGEDGEVVLITLNRPLVCIQPLAVDRAVLVWLNYKNAYEYWTEQRATLNKEVLTATQQVFEKVPQFSSLPSASSITSNVYLQLTVDDIGICLPLNACRTVSNQVDSTETRDALVVTLESTIISACNSGSLVCKARFKGFCLRFAPEFETSLDDWKPDLQDMCINLCTVSEGTYEVCSRTSAGHAEKVEPAKWLLNVMWAMEGVELHLDVNIGKHLSALARTLTMLTGAPDNAMAQQELDSDDDADDVDTMTQSQTNESLPAFIFDAKIDARQRAKLLEIEMNEQAKTVNDLKMLGASASTIEQEMRRLQDLESVVFHDFRRDVMKRLRRQSVKATAMKDRLGIGPKNIRSKSFRVPSPTIEVKEPRMRCDSHNSSEGMSLSVDSSPCHISDGTTQKVKFSETSTQGRHSSMTSGSSDSYPIDDSEGNNEVFLTMGSTTLHRTPTPSNVSDTETETVTLTNVSTDDVAVSSTNQNQGPINEMSYLSTLGEGGDSYSYSNTPSGPSSATTTSPQAPTYSGHSSSHNSGAQTPGGGVGSASSSTVKPQDQSIDLELDVRVTINSGKCNLYTRCLSKEEESKRMKKERSFSGGIYEMAGSPGSQRKKNDGRMNSSFGKLRQQPVPTMSISADTIFYIPGLDVKIHYESHNIHEETPVGGGGSSGGDPTNWSTPGQSNSQQFNTTFASANTFRKGIQGAIGGSSGSGSGGRKRASLFTWLTLQSIQEETTITPNILEFLELALEPLPMPQAQTKSPASAQEPVFKNEPDKTADGGGGVPPYVYASFPVDVVVYFHMQPSTIRFSCQPVSRVECILQLPSLNIIFSSKRAEEGALFLQSIGGLSVTGVLEDFSLYVFHPYGGKRPGNTPYMSFASLTDSERKDSLSVNVEFVKFHLSRSRKIHFKPDGTTKVKLPPPMPLDSKAIIRFSTIIDIGAAHFKYDMRRLTEILAFPRAWYRKSIVRRLFLGDFYSGSTANDWEDTSPNERTSNGETPAGHTGMSKRLSASSGDSSLTRDAGSSSVSGSNNISHTAAGLHSPAQTPPTGGGAGSRARDKLRLNFDNDASHKRSPKLSGLARSDTLTETMTSDDGDSEDNVTVQPQQLNKAVSWETLVLFAVNFTRLNVQMNMGNVMGNVVWTTKDFKADGRLSIGSTGHKNMYIGLSLGGSALDAKGGIVGGIIELSEINMYLKIREDPGMEPDHTVGLKLFASQSRLDYMGTSVLMGRVSSFAVTMRDEWKLKQCAEGDEDTTRRGATIFILGDLEWDQLQLIICKSTTADLLKMYHKLDEFFAQQFKSSKRVFSSLQPGPVRHKSSLKHKNRDQRSKVASVLGVAMSQDARHHRHWQGVLERVSGLRLTTLPLPMPDSGTVLGGSLELHGKTISLACFHGINFKSKSWALFSLQEPYINFTSEVQEVPGEGPSTHIVQNLTFSLGVNEQTHAQHVSMATVCRITRTMVFPPQFKTIQEWFHYAFCTSELDNIDRFPSLDRSDSLNSADGRRSDDNRMSTSSTTSSEGKRSSAPRMQDHNHTSETIFALPSMQLHLNTKHLQTSTTPDFMDTKPVVDCSLVTEFQDHIFVTVDAENFFFLHDLIASYVKDTKEKMASEKENDKEKEDKKGKVRVNEPTQLLQQDWREFTCGTWHLEPTVRLLSWATKNLEPYGIDYILQKLGFSHARTTIPKWLQRGCMDPLDRLLSLIMFRMIVAIHEHDSANR